MLRCGDRLNDSEMGRWAGVGSLTERLMLGAGGGRACVADVFDIPGQTPIVSCGVKDRVLLGRTLG
jgi:hypothetical protein